MDIKCAFGVSRKLLKSPIQNVRDVAINLVLYVGRFMSVLFSFYYLKDDIYIPKDRQKFMENLNREKNEVFIKVFRLKFLCFY